MTEHQSLNHTRWDCKYHAVFIPKRRKKMIFGALRQHLGEIFRELALQKESNVVEAHLMSDHIHKRLSNPPKHSVSNLVGFFKGKSAISIARQFGGPQRNFTSEVFRARGNFVSTVGFDEQMVRVYIRHKESKDARYDQMNTNCSHLRTAHGLPAPSRRPNDNPPALPGVA